MKIKSIVYTIMIFCAMYLLMSFESMSFDVFEWSQDTRLLYVVLSVILSAIVLFIAWDRVHLYIHRDDMEKILIEFHTQATDKEHPNYLDFVDFVYKFIKDLK